MIQRWIQWALSMVAYVGFDSDDSDELRGMVEIKGKGQTEVCLVLSAR